MDETQLKQMLDEQKREIQGMFTKSQQSIADLNTKFESLEQKTINQPSTPQSSNPKPDESGGGGSLFDWHQAQLRTDDGKVNPELISAMKKAGADEQVVSQMVGTIEAAQEMSQFYKDWSIKQTVGDEDKLTKLLEWGKDNTSNPQVKAANHLINDVRTLSDGLTILKNQAEASGFQFDEQTGPDQKPTSNEPSRLPPTATGGVTGPSPLKPGSPEANRAVSDAMKSRDPEQMQAVEARIKAGMSNAT